MIGARDMAFPRLKCYIRGEQVFDRNLEDLGIHLLKCDMWEAATITWPQGIVTAVQKPDGSLKITPQYRTLSEAGPDHDKVFTCEARVAGEVLGRGEGRTKKEAQQHAAAAALERLGAEAPG